MQVTEISLLARAGSGSDTAWRRMYAVYQPLILGWLTRHGINPDDAEELTQDVLLVVSRELPTFQHSGRRGAFRRWLSRIAANRARAYWRAGKLRPTAAGGSEFLAVMQQLEDPSSELSQAWEKEHDRYVLRHLIEAIENEFTEDTVTAFRLQVFELLSAEAVASRLGLSVGAVYSARSRVLRRLREEAVGLVDDVLLE